jgi:hypothetical protein
MTYTCKNMMASENTAYLCEDAYVTLAIESIKDLSYISKLPGACFFGLQLSCGQGVRVVMDILF